jgi:hypothetical protein
MTAIASARSQPTAAHLIHARFAALTGAAFALVYLLGTASLNAPIGATDQKLVEFWSDSGNQRIAVFSMFCFMVAGLVFLVFMSHVRTALASAGDKASEIVFGSSLIFVALLAVSGAARGVIGVAAQAGKDPLPGPDILRYLPQVSYASGGLALVAGALAIGTTSWMIMRTGVFARWLAWLGFVAALAIVVCNVALIGVMAIPAMLFWALGMSFELWRTSKA